MATTNTYCYLPLVVTVSFDEDPRKYPVVSSCAAARPQPWKGVLPVLSRLVPGRCGARFPPRAHVGAGRQCLRAYAPVGSIGSTPTA